MTEEKKQLSPPLVGLARYGVPILLVPSLKGGPAGSSVKEWMFVMWPAKIPTFTFVVKMISIGRWWASKGIRPWTLPI